MHSNNILPSLLNYIFHPDEATGTLIIVSFPYKNITPQVNDHKQSFQSPNSSPHSLIIFSNYLVMNITELQVCRIRCLIFTRMKAQWSCWAHKMSVDLHSQEEVPYYKCHRLKVENNHTFDYGSDQYLIVQQLLTK